MTPVRKPISISNRLLRTNLLVSGTALLLACIAFFSYDLYSFEHSLVRTLAAEARIVGSNSVSAILFDDPESAQSNLAALSRSPEVVGAAIVTTDGKVFAAYQRSGLPARLPHMDPDVAQRQWISGPHVLVATRITLNGKQEGAVYISAVLTQLEYRARRYLLIALIILALCWIIAIRVTRGFRATIAGPIVALAEMSRAVSRDRNYSLRAPPSQTHDETAVLIESFNEMLQQIEQRDSALRQARDELEQRVKERTAELQDANRELEAFSYTVAHDLRGPLDAISGIGFLLQQAYAGKLDADGREMLGRLRLSSAKMADLIEDLLNLSRSGNSALERSTVNLSQIAFSVAEELRSAEPDRQVKFVIAPGAIVLADAALMRVAIGNLLRNSWKYSSHHSTARIEFGFQRVRGELAYFVRDDGAGFNPDLAGRLFKPFQRLHTQSQFSGTGIGLATVQRIVSRHGGHIWAEGAPEQGATFYFSLDS